jgi:hypothetical protein
LLDARQRQHILIAHRHSSLPFRKRTLLVDNVVMVTSVRVELRRQFCSRCGQVMFEYYRSPDGHFGLAAAPWRKAGAVAGEHDEVFCALCGARYRLLERTNAMGQAVERQ